jgi:ATP-dependent RNA helicase DeaD
VVAQDVRSVWWRRLHTTRGRNLNISTLHNLHEASQASFADLPVSRQVHKAIADQGWETPTPIQALALPALLRGEDVVGLAQTGSGKTAAFSIPLIESIDQKARGVQALVLVPTRELAAQAATELRSLSRGGPVRPPVVLTGGVPIGPQIKALKDRSAAVVVGTPGRVLDHLQRGTLRLGSVRFLVLDEADRMLDMGFAPDVGRILSHTPEGPDGRQTALFSATMPKEIRGMVKRHMRSPEWLVAESEAPTVDTVEQVYYRVDGRDKTRALRSLIDAEEEPVVIVFRRTKHGATKLHRQLERDGYKAGLLHGGKTQAQRTKTLAAFAGGRTRILVATNVAARGLDIPDVSHVINYDLPEDVDTYVHRIGRTARAGKEGVAATLIGDAEIKEFNKIKRALPAEVRESRLPIPA